MSSVAIGPDTRVTCRFEIRLDDESVVDSGFDKAPAEFEFGDGSLLPGFERAMIGMRAGERKAHYLAPDQGFGHSNPDNVQRIARRRFADDIELTPGLVVSFADVKKTELPGVILTVDNQYVEVDFNHPLAGKPLWFEVEVLNVILVRDS